MTLWPQLSPEGMQNQLETAEREQIPLTSPAGPRGTFWACGQTLKQPSGFPMACERPGSCPYCRDGETELREAQGRALSHTAPKWHWVPPKIILIVLPAYIFQLNMFKPHMGFMERIVPACGLQGCPPGATSVCPKQTQSKNVKLK